MSRTAVLDASRGAKARRRASEFLFAFVCVFVGLALPSRGLGPWYVRTHAFLGNALLPRGLTSGIELSFRATEASLEKEPWSLPLIITAPAGVAISVPIDLRLLTFLPTACFVALAVATPLPTRHQSLRLLATGLAILQPLLWALSAIPIVSFLGGTGPVRVFELGVATHVVLQTAYRALVAPPGMTYVIPLFLWWILVVKMTRLRVNFRISETTFEIRSQGKRAILRDRGL